MSCISAFGSHQSDSGICVSRHPSSDGDDKPSAVSKLLLYLQRLVALIMCLLESVKVTTTFPSPSSSCFLLLLLPRQLPSSFFSFATEKTAG